MSAVEESRPRLGDTAAVGSQIQDVIAWFERTLDFEPGAEYPFRMSSERVDRMKQRDEEVVDPDVSIDFPPGLGIGVEGTWEGREGWWRFWRGWLDAWGEYEFRFTRWQEIGPYAVCQIDVRTSGQASGVPVTWSNIQAWRLRDGRMWKLGQFPNRRAAREWIEGGSDRRVRFEKWQALGNDYVIVEERELPWELTADRIRRICDPHFGIGSDGVLLLSPADDERHVAELRIFNPDGSEAELSGNGAREAVLYLRNAGWTDRETFTIVTKAGEITPTIAGPDTVSMAIGRASVVSDDFPGGPQDGRGKLTAGDREWSFQHVNVGNPQCVIEAGDEVEELDLAALGPAIEGNTDLFPNRTNVSFIAVKDSTVRARIFERGVGETLSSGTGASGAAVAAHLRGAAGPITVKLDGGELTVEVGPELDVVLTGTAEPVYRGELSPALVRALG